jgi:HAD superfamily hydrolase (TIGR01509 family)
MKRLAALIFDVDGTLADTEEVHRIAFNQAFEQAGLSWVWSKDLYRELLEVTGGKERIRHYINTREPDFSVAGSLQEYIARLHKAKTDAYTHMLNNGLIALRPGVKRLMTEARETGVRLAIATTTSMPNIEALIVNALDADGMSWFDVIAAGDVVPHKKPASDIYDYALQRLNLSPEECVAFEDSENGIKSSMGAQLDTIITLNDYTQDHNFNGARIVLDHMGEPDMPFQVLQGNAHGHKYITLEMINRLRTQAK